MTEAEHWALAETTSNLAKKFLEFPSTDEAHHDGTTGEIWVVTDSGARYKVLVQLDGRDEERWERYQRRLAAERAG